MSIWDGFRFAIGKGIAEIALAFLILFLIAMLYIIIAIFTERR